jgi:hypothetical protein
MNEKMKKTNKQTNKKIIIGKKREKECSKERCRFWFIFLL